MGICQPACASTAHVKSCKDDCMARMIFLYGFSADIVVDICQTTRRFGTISINPFGTLQSEEMSITVTHVGTIYAVTQPAFWSSTISANMLVKSNSYITQTII